jgi:hypothetical protein
VRGTLEAFKANEPSLEGTPCGAARLAYRNLRG